MCDSMCDRCELSRFCYESCIGKSRVRMLACSRYIQKKRITNAARLRAMTDEELADFLEGISITNGWLDGLRQEVE